MPVLVMGSGISGLLHVALARALGAGTILATDINPWRLEAARRFGADEVFPAAGAVREGVLAATGGRGADRVIVCTGAIGAVNQSMHLVASGGTVLLFGAPDQQLIRPLLTSENPSGFLTKSLVAEDRSPDLPR